MFAARLGDAAAPIVFSDVRKIDPTIALRNLDPSLGALMSAVEPGVVHAACRLHLDSGWAPSPETASTDAGREEERKLRRCAREAYARGRIGEAESALRRCKESGCEDPAVHHALGTIALLERDDLDAARQHFERALEHARPARTEDAARALICLACVCEGAGDVVSALAHAEAACRTCGRLPEAHYAVARYFAANGRGTGRIGSDLLTAFRGARSDGGGWKNAAFWDRQSFRVDLCMLAACDRAFDAKRHVVDESQQTFRDELADLCTRRTEGLSQFLRLIGDYVAIDADAQLSAILAEGSERLARARGLISENTVIDLCQAAHELHDVAWSLAPRSVSAALMRARQLASQDASVSRGSNRHAVGKLMTSVGSLRPKGRVSAAQAETIRGAKTLASRLEQMRQIFQGMRCIACCGTGMLGHGSVTCDSCGGTGFTRRS